ncbi:helix-turn-helix domain-containing protein [Streptomyces sp. YS-3]|uniref:helix-turn-helix domain-containing protein n=1 Tax=Streptomyces sp. YS-3 TaxID=3381352 RepID=UPI0038625754
MGRREKEITTPYAALRDLAEWLRDQRAHAKLTYRQLASRAGLHATTLQRAASGKSVPTLVAVLAYTRGCDGLPEEARRLWQRARREHIRADSRFSRQPAPRPGLVRDFTDLSAALRGLYEEACAPPLRLMEERAGGYGALPRSSAHRIVNKQTVPHCQEQYMAFLRACEVPPDMWKEWEDAWSRAWRLEKQEDAGLAEGSAAHDNFLIVTPREDHYVSTQMGMGVPVQTGPRYYRPLVPRPRPSVQPTAKQHDLYEVDGASPDETSWASISPRMHRAALIRRMERRLKEERNGMEPLFSLPGERDEAADPAA